MTEDTLFEPPQITDADIRWVSTLLGPEESAFYGDCGTDPRQDVLKCMGSLDVAACPGSGKTTLLVAKLAILAEKWRYRTRGICVLSHTNVARHEIETKIGNTNAGRSLLSYPHYIGTIHGFVNDFLALPWLRSKGNLIKMIDTEICEDRRWNKLAWGSRSYLERKKVERSNIRILDANYRLAKKNGQFPCSNSTPTYKDYQRSCQETAKEGYYCYDDLFVWAQEMTDQLPDLVYVIRDRFPILFIDEAQDNSEEQAAILHKIFMEGDGAVIRQRFGDNNQAIFDSMETKEKEATTQKYKFPDEAIVERLPNSHRFGQTIADLVDPLGLVPYGLRGQGPKKKLFVSDMDEGPHTIFLFDEGKMSRLLDAYAELLINTFPAEKLGEGKFWAVGQVHKPSNQTEADKFPRHIGHYWPAYSPELAGLDPRPRTLAQYIFVGLEKAKMTGETYLAVEKISEGILRLVRMVEGGKPLASRRHNHRYILELLKGCDDIQRQYQELLERIVVRREPLTRNAWDDKSCGIRRSVQKIAETISGTSLSGHDNEFLEWTESLGGQSMRRDALKSRSNIYQYPNDDPKVQIRIGSIHSVKGMTHTATLVMETFWYEHNLELLLPWLNGSKSGALKEGARQKSRLKLHYVAMTRPTHLLCLAMKQSCVSDDCLQNLEGRGWQIRTI